ncbi:MAG: hypothetical protein KA760_03700 [Steroidobacteraceae bacterium]|nr:hypothetical protein [Steroidobacteraceae bacterium]
MVGLLVVPLIGCLPDVAPVREWLAVSFPADGSAELTLSVAIRPAKDLEGAPARRAAAAERDILDQADPWSRRLAPIELASERTVAEKVDGQLVRWSRSVRLADPDQFERIFSDTSIDVQWQRDPQQFTLTIVPLRPAGVSRRDREKVEDALQAACRLGQSYYAALANLYQYMDANPEREPALLAAMGGGDVAGDDAEDAGGDSGIAPLEADLLRAYDESTDALFEFFSGLLLVRSEDDSYTLDEISRQMLDPFPAAMVVRPAGEVLEAEGFVAGETAASGPGEWAVPTLSLWAALDRAGRQWAEPDPVLAFVRQIVDDPDSDPDPAVRAELARTPRRANPPDAMEIERVLRRELTPAPVYRLVWRAPAGVIEATSAGGGARTNHSR